MADSRRKLTVSGHTRRVRNAARKVDPWVGSDDYYAKHDAKRAETQAQADLLGMDHGLEARPPFKEWASFLLPALPYRHGHEYQCEIVHPTNLARTLPGHGPQAKRPPSPTGPFYHGAPWCGREQALREIAAFDVEWKQSWADWRMRRFAYDSVMPALRFAWRVRWARKLAAEEGV